MSSFKDVFDDKIKIFLIDEKTILSYKEFVQYINTEELHNNSFLIKVYGNVDLIKNTYKIVVLKFLLDVLKPEVTNQ